MNTEAPGCEPRAIRRGMTVSVTLTHDEWIAKGKTLFESGAYATPMGAHIGVIKRYGLDVYEGSPQQWKDALRGTP
jgi:hypothetical protein